MTETPDTVLQGVLDAWQKAIADHHPEQVAELFTTDNVFQGLRPYTTGRPGVADYYASQPIGMTVDYRVLRTRELGDDALLGWVEAEFAFVEPDREPLPVNLTVVLQREPDAWRIAHYHVSRRP